LRQLGINREEAFAFTVCLESQKPRHPELVSGSHHIGYQTPIPSARDGVTIAANIFTFGIDSYL
jgi:hypothetical protein